METLRMTSKEFREYIKQTKVIPGSNTNKYHAQKVEGYDSRKEFRRAMYLRDLERKGKIHSLKEQVPFELIPSQRDDQGNLLERAVFYIADFVYKDENNNLIVEDTKGYATRDYKIKRKLMLYVHGIRIQEIKS